MSPISDYLNALAGASDTPIRLNYGDTDAEAIDGGTLRSIIAAADTANEPLYVRCAPSNGVVPFL